MFRTNTPDDRSLNLPRTLYSLARMILFRGYFANTIFRNLDLDGLTGKYAVL